MEHFHLHCYPLSWNRSARNKHTLRSDPLFHFVCRKTWSTRKCVPHKKILFPSYPSPHVFTHAPRIPLGLPLVFSSEHELLMRGVIMFPILNLHHIGVSSLFLQPSRLRLFVLLFTCEQTLRTCYQYIYKYFQSGTPPGVMRNSSSSGKRSRTSRMYWKFEEHPGGKRGSCSHCTIRGRQTQGKSPLGWWKSGTTRRKLNHGRWSKFVLFYRNKGSWYHNKLWKKIFFFLEKSLFATHFF